MTDLQTTAADDQLEPDELEAIAAVLNRLEWVEWDRAAGPPSSFGIFGWIPRADGGRDFVELEFRGAEPVGYSTSSAEHSAQIGTILWPGEEDHYPCIPVPEILPNVTRLAPWQRTRT